MLFIEIFYVYVKISIVQSERKFLLKYYQFCQIQNNNKKKKKYEKKKIKLHKVYYIEFSVFPFPSSNNYSNNNNNNF